MKCSPQQYARAFGEVAAKARSPEEKSAFVTNLTNVIRRNRDLPSRKKIIEAIEKFLRKQSGKRTVSVVSARPLTSSQNDIVASFVKQGDFIEYKVRPELVAGLKIIMNDETEFDGSLKRKLDKLFGVGQKT